MKTASKKRTYPMRHREKEYPSKSGRAPYTKGKKGPMSRARMMNIQDNEQESDEEVDEKVQEEEDYDDGEDPNETAAEKRIRLAKRYLERVKEDTEARRNHGFDAADLDRDLIAERLRDEVLETSGKLFRRIAFQYATVSQSGILPLSRKQYSRAHQASITCVAVTTGPKWFIYTGSKDGSIIKWDPITQRRLHTFRGLQKNTPPKPIIAGHTEPVTCLAVSPDNRFIVSGGLDSRLNVWSVKDNIHLHCFRGHRDSITGVTFKKQVGGSGSGGVILYSCSKDRTVKVWSLEEMAYVDTLFGHQEVITSIDSLTMDRCVTTGGRDRTLRIWKIMDESQLVYRASQHSHGTLDVVYQLDDEHLVSGDDMGTLSLWNMNKKKPLYSLSSAHGVEPLTEGERDAGMTQCKLYWIISLTGVRYSDLFFSGSWNGDVRMWQLSDNKRQFNLIGQIPIGGFINALAVVNPTMWPSLLVDSNNINQSNTNTDINNNNSINIKQRRQIPSSNVICTLHLIVGIGQEHKDGRWWRLTQCDSTHSPVRNVVEVIELIPLMNG